MTVELGQIWREKHPQRLVKVTHVWPNDAVTIRACDENGNFVWGSKYLVRSGFGEDRGAVLFWPLPPRC